MINSHLSDGLHTLIVVISAISSTRRTSVVGMSERKETLVRFSVSASLSPVHACIVQSIESYAIPMIIASPNPPVIPDADRGDTGIAREEYPMTAAAQRKNRLPRASVAETLGLRSYGGKQAESVFALPLWKKDMRRRDGIWIEAID